VALFAATPAGFPKLSDLGRASIRPMTSFVTGELQSMVALAALEAAQRQPAGPAKKYAAIERLPDSGAVVMAVANLTAPHDRTLPAQHFMVSFARPALQKITYTAFAHPVLDDHRAIALARLPAAKPARVFTADADGVASANPDVLAYAPAVANDITAPFDAVLGGAQIVEDDGLPRPHPRPDPNIVLGWLDGRALGQFAPGQHDWVQNQLPISVFTAKEQKCLAQGIYFEARGESEDGQAAVAQVILNRVRNPAYPDTICDVVYQDQRHRHACQFSFACDGRSEVIAERQQWATAARIARDVTEGRIWIAEVGDSTHYHAKYVRPGWGRRMIKVDRIGAHVFYRTRLGGWS
jgi:hypothetical protein